MAKSKKMQKWLAAGSKIILPKHQYYAQKIIKNQLKRLIKKSVANKYLFILSAPLCGSTVLNELLSSSSNVSCNNNWGTREGQKLPATREMMFDHNKRWDATMNFDWPKIKKEWRKYWDVTKPVLLEKSPPNIIRTGEIEKTFRPCYFIVLVRNPYAQCEGLMRRKEMAPKEAAELVLSRMAIQKQNTEKLKSVLILRYEELCDKTECAVEKMIKFLPEIKSLSVGNNFRSHNKFGKNGSLENTNNLKLNQLNAEALKQINCIFSKREDVLKNFNYNLIN